MSKIYEALLRAEQDRTATGGKEPAWESALDPAPAPVVDDPRESWPQSGAAPTDDAPPPPPRAENRAAPASDRSASSERPATQQRRANDFDLSAISVTAWSPAVLQLPALDDRGGAVEQFRSLRSRMHEFRDLNTLKSILVSSGLPQEGKSFIAANLAISFARHKASRVLLIDGDMRRSSLHHLLGCPSEPGLAEYLAGTATIAEIMHRAESPEHGPPLHHGIASLTFIGAGKDSDKAADLSGNYRFDELIEVVSPHFDWIVVDSSPVNLVSDGVNLARACDGVLLIARGGITKFEVAQRALTELKASNVLGFVLNAVSKPPHAGGYYGYDSYDSYDSYSAYNAVKE
ncbi:MAG TPA: CpsD/CapB family tyrosine-protein kinase [Acidobacteriaceae bacterium]|nr:CpsD/CapB family tyrosine-protein kinase [Acidobacteriaceae bacterium]